MNLVIFSGNLAKDAKVVTTSTGKQFCVTTLALREDLRPEEKPAVFVDLIIWGERAEKLAKYLIKGRAISVTGRLEIIKVHKNNNTYTSARVVVDTLEFLGKKTIEAVSASETKVESINNSSSETIEDSEFSEEVPF